MHRDIKPENLLINLAEGKIKLCDFGFARMIPNVCGEDLTDYVATRWYRAPELLLANSDYGPGVDVFAIGCIMGEVIDGQPLLPGESELDQLCHIQSVIGPLRDGQLRVFDTNPRFVGLSIPERPLSGQDVPTLEERFRHNLSRRGISLLRSLVEVHESSRWTAERALQHEFFDNMSSDTRCNKSRFRDVSRFDRMREPMLTRGAADRTSIKPCFSTTVDSLRCSYASLSLRRN
jgi:cyclin-dependent kinase-like